jgi:Lar family restriction alleviation protein
MTNGEKFKTAEDRHTEFSNWCYERECEDCDLHFCNCPEGCAFHWLNLKYKEELKPCPFCGCNKVEIIESVIENGHYVHCEICDAKSSTYYRAENAVNAWNRRYDNGND